MRQGGEQGIDLGIESCGWPWFRFMSRGAYKNNAGAMPLLVWEERMFCYLTFLSRRKNVHAMVRLSWPRASCQ